MNDELMFQLAVQLTIAKIRAHFISPATRGCEDWTDDQIRGEWDRLRRLWREGHKEGNVHPLSD